jgi:UDP-N-acetylglucosamine--N-acetylmuramyl-(pentapeptide) pyrophosphoryl-undecaprenol N-acetylglucosamine transferase
MEAALVARKGLAYTSIPSAGVHGVGLRMLPGNLWRLMRGVPSARRVIGDFKPDVLFFTGGFVGVPMALAGWRFPKVVFVPDVEPALALKWISRISDVIAVTAEISRRYYSSGKRLVVSGYPTRSEFQGLTRQQARSRLDLDLERPVVLVFGGSRGARSINQALWKCLVQLLETAQVIHVTGELDWPQVSVEQERLPPHRGGDYRAFPYLHEEMAYALAAADLVVSRAGAASLGEYPFFNLPSVLIPYPHAWRYQKVNSEYLVERGAAVALADEVLTENLLPTILGLLNNPARMESMAKAAGQLATPNAARVIAQEIEQLVSLRGGASA